jgi:hypothetical protein
MWWPRFPRMEPTDQLDAPDRRLPESRVRRFAKRKSAFRTSSIFLVNTSLFSTSLIERVGRWPWTRCFGASQGQLWEQSRRLDPMVPTPHSRRASSACARRLILPRDLRPLDTVRVVRQPRCLLPESGSAESPRVHLGTPASLQASRPRGSRPRPVVNGCCRPQARAVPSARPGFEPPATQREASSRDSASWTEDWVADRRGR